MDNAWGTADPFAVFTVAQILNNGQTTVLSYEMPPPLFLNKTHAQILRDRVYTQEKAVVHESNCVIEKGEGLLLLSDGITQAGIGKRFVYGWEVEGVCSFLQSIFPMNPLLGPVIVNAIHDQARAYWPRGTGDDCSVVLALNRPGVVVNFMSGPPLDKADDADWVNHFIETDGIHIISGGTTAMIASRILNRFLEIEEVESAITPPSYKISGIELVTEGMVTLNQVYNLLDEDVENFPEDSPASDLAYFLKMADKINIWLGQSKNLSDGRIEFKQQGLLNRNKIMIKIMEQLREQGKLVVEYLK